MPRPCRAENSVVGGGEDSGERVANVPQKPSGAHLLGRLSVITGRLPVGVDLAGVPRADLAVELPCRTAELRTGGARKARGRS